MYLVIITIITIYTFFLDMDGWSSCAVAICGNGCRIKWKETSWEMEDEVFSTLWESCKHSKYPLLSITPN